jgi:hypothetical protein
MRIQNPHSVLLEGPITRRKLGEEDSVSFEECAAAPIDASPEDPLSENSGLAQAVTVEPAWVSISVKLAIQRW